MRTPSLSSFFIFMKPELHYSVAMSNDGSNCRFKKQKNMLFYFCSTPDQNEI